MGSHPSTYWHNQPPILSLTFLMMNILSSHQVGALDLDSYIITYCRVESFFCVGGKYQINHGLSHPGRNRFYPPKMEENGGKDKILKGEQFFILKGVQFSVSWIAYLWSTRWCSNLPGNACWVHSWHDPPYLYCQQGEQIGYREMEICFLFRHGILLWIMRLSITHKQESFPAMLFVLKESIETRHCVGQESACRP